MNIDEFTDRMVAVFPLIIRKGHIRIFKVLAGSGVNVPQFFSLEFLRSGDSVKMRDMAHEMNISGPAVTKIVDRLEEQGFIKREPSTEDRRVIFLKITKSGINLINKVNKKRAEVIKDAFSKLSDAERRSYINILEKLNKILSESNQ